DPHHGAIQDQPDDRLLGDRAGIPGLPIAFHLAPHAANRIFADRAAKDGREGAAPDAYWSRQDRRRQSANRLAWFAAGNLVAPSLSMRLSPPPRPRAWRAASRCRPAQRSPRVIAGGDHGGGQ